MVILNPTKKKNEIKWNWTGEWTVISCVTENHIGLCWSDGCCFRQPPVSWEVFKDTAADICFLRHRGLTHILVCPHTLFDHPLPPKHTQTHADTTSITHAHTKWEEYVGHKRTRGEKEGECWLMEKGRLAAGGFFFFKGWLGAVPAW